jgi:hypothetical protein
MQMVETMIEQENDANGRDHDRAKNDANGGDHG